MQITGLNKTTLLDYPKHLAATIFFGVCDFRCPFCHNATLVLTPYMQPTISPEEVLSFLEKRAGILEGVCITGGEPTLQKDLPSFISQIKQLGLKVKLDTNGNNPTMLQSLLESNSLDYVAMDIKNSKEKYGVTIGKEQFKTCNIEESIRLLLSGSVDYEFRTTVVSEFHKADDFVSIGEWIQGARAYYLQPFIDSGDIIRSGLSSCSKEELEHMRDLVAPYVQYVSIRALE